MQGKYSLVHVKVKVVKLTFIPGTAYGSTGTVIPSHLANS